MSASLLKRRTPSTDYFGRCGVRRIALHSLLCGAAVMGCLSLCDVGFAQESGKSPDPDEAYARFKDHVKEFSDELRDKIKEELEDVHDSVESLVDRVQKLEEFFLNPVKTLIDSVFGDVNGVANGHFDDSHPKPTRTHRTHRAKPPIKATPVPATGNSLSDSGAPSSPTVVQSSGFSIPPALSGTEDDSTKKADDDFSDKPAQIVTLRVNDDLPKDQLPQPISKPSTDDTAETQRLTFDEDRPKGEPLDSNVDQPNPANPTSTTTRTPVDVSPDTTDSTPEPSVNRRSVITMRPDPRYIDAPTTFDPTPGYILMPAAPAFGGPSVNAAPTNTPTTAAPNSDVTKPAPFVTLRVNDNLPKTGGAPVIHSSQGNAPATQRLTFDERAPKGQAPVSVGKQPASASVGPMHASPRVSQSAPMTSKPASMSHGTPAAPSRTNPTVAHAPAQVAKAPSSRVTVTPVGRQSTVPANYSAPRSGSGGSSFQPRGVLMRLGIDPSTLQEGTAPNDLMERIRGSS